MRILLVLVLALTLVTCGKNKFETKPRLEVKSISSDEVFQNETLRVTLKYFDKEGDLSGGILTYIRVRTNTVPLSDPGGQDKIDTIRAALPEFPDKSQAEIMQPITYNFMDEENNSSMPSRNDSMYFRFTVMDKEGNASDTVETKIVVAVQP